MPLPDFSLKGTLQQTRPEPATKSVFISKISAEKLFGRFDYDLPRFGQGPTDFSKFILLYGDNGTGKTTILNLVFHLLSAAKDRGHRSSIAEIPFRKFEVAFNDGTRISAQRTREMTGGYRLSVESKALEFSVDFDPRKETPGRFSSAQQEAQFLAFLSSLGESLYFLPAHRIIVSDRLPRFGADDEDPYTFTVTEAGAMRRSRMQRYIDLGYEFRNRSLFIAMNLAADWIRRKGFIAANQGTDDANTIYADVIERIADSSPLLQQKLIAGHYAELSATLERLANLSSEYAKFKFTTPLQIGQMIEVLRRPADVTAPIVESVVKSYIEGTTARLKALENLYKITNSFIDNLNRFFRWKSVQFDLEKGLTVMNDDGTPIPPTLLSSGEQHLLLMFCHTLSSRDQKSIFIIDEPELSLNIKWQRNLIDALLDIAHDSPVQFILATHSIETVHEHMDCVAELEPRVTTDSGVEAGGEGSGPSDNS